MAWSWDKKHITVAIAGVSATVLFGVVACVSSDKPDKPTGGDSQVQSGSSNTQVQGGGQVAGTINNYADDFKRDAAGLSLEDANKKAEKYKDKPPPAGDMAQYLVVAPGNLYVRDTPDVKGKHIGAAYHEAIVYAGCSVQNDFDAVLTDEVDGLWIKIHWPTLKPSNDMLASQPSDPLQGWVYGGLVVPAGHNGKIPTCS